MQLLFLVKTPMTCNSLNQYKHQMPPLQAWPYFISEMWLYMNKYWFENVLDLKRQHVFDWSTEKFHQKCEQKFKKQNKKIKPTKTTFPMNTTKEMRHRRFHKAR